MILKNQFTPRSMWPYVRLELALGAVAGVAAWLLVDRAALHWVAMPVTLATVLGTALSILLAVRVNSCYQRWWEASGIWAQITALSRNLTRVVITVGESKRANGQNAEAIAAFQRGMVMGQIAWVNALRLQLRGESDWASLAPRLSPEEYRLVAAADNKAGVLLQLHSQRIYRAYAAGVLAGLDNFQMEVALAGLAQQQALTERTKGQPMPRVYAIFSRYFVHLYVLVFPFCVIGALTQYRWIVIPTTLVLAFAFQIVESIGTAVEHPFGNTKQDVPLSAICVTIERDLLEQLGDPNRPPAPQAVDGYLF